MAKGPRILLGCLLATLSLAGCGGPDKDAICKDVEACRKGNAKDIEACKVELDYADDAASDLGCSDELDAFLQCIQDHGTCENKVWGLYGKSASACDAETHAWEHCSGGSSVTSDPPQGN